MGKIDTFIDGLIGYDYILFGSVFIIFLLLIIVGIIKRDKIKLAVSLIFLAFTILIFGTVFGYINMHEYLFKNTTSITSQKELTFTKALVLKGILKNESNFDFKECEITADVYKVSGNAFKDYLFKLNSFKKVSIFENDILKGEEIEFKMIVEPFTYSKDYNVSVGASCK